MKASTTRGAKTGLFAANNHVEQNTLYPLNALDFP
jgi:hypothetical protein